MQKIFERTAHFTDSVIRRMTRVSNQYGAVNLSQGFPDFAPPNQKNSCNIAWTVEGGALKACLTALNGGDFSAVYLPL